MVWYLRQKEMQAFVILKWIITTTYGNLPVKRNFTTALIAYNFLPNGQTEGIKHMVIQAIIKIVK